MSITYIYDKYEIGSPYPLHNRAVGVDKSVAQLNSAFFDVLSYLRNPSSQEIKAIRKGRLKYGFYFDHQLPHIPFLVLDFPEINSTQDLSINLLKVKDTGRCESWLLNNGNSIYLYLIEAKTNILKAQRLFTINPEAAALVKVECAKQLEYYKSSDEVEKSIQTIMSKNTTSDMIKKIKMYTL